MGWHHFLPKTIRVRLQRVTQSLPSGAGTCLHRTLHSLAWELLIYWCKTDSEAMQSASPPEEQHSQYSQRTYCSKILGLQNETYSSFLSVSIFFLFLLESCLQFLFFFSFTFLFFGGSSLLYSSLFPSVFLLLLFFFFLPFYSFFFFETSIINFASLKGVFWSPLLFSFFLIEIPPTFFFAGLHQQTNQSTLK